MKFEFRSFFSKYRLKSLFTINFSKIMLFVVTVLVIISTYVYNSSISIINNEFTQTNTNNVQKVSEVTDTVIKEIQTMSTYISLDSTVQLFISSREPEQLIEEFDARIKEKVSMFSMMNHYIDSVYVYSEKSNSILSSSGSCDYEAFSDLAWAETYRASTEAFSIFPREKDNTYPYLITIIKRVTTADAKGAVIVNINLRELSTVFDNPDDQSQEIYIIDDDEETIIFNKNMDRMFEKVSSHSALEEWRSSNHSIITKEGQNFALASQKSKYYDWTYCSVKYLSEYREKLALQSHLIVAILVIALVVGIIIAILLALSTYRPIKGLIEILENPEKRNHEGNNKSSDEIKYIAQYIIKTVNANEELQNELAEYLDMLNKAKISALQLQMNPHFLFNTINLINLMMIDNYGLDNPASDMLGSLSEILRYILKTDEELVSVSQEVKYNSLYVSMLDKRYGNKIKTEWDVHPDVLDKKLPKLCLQPIIENAFYHGLSVIEDYQPMLSISICSDTDTLSVVISDNGCGIEKSKLDQIKKSFYDDSSLHPKSIGLKNVHQRIQLLFGKEYGLQIESTPGNGCVVTFILPLI